MGYLNWECYNLGQCYNDRKLTCFALRINSSLILGKGVNFFFIENDVLLRGRPGSTALKNRKLKVSFFLHRSHKWY